MSSSRCSPLPDRRGKGQTRRSVFSLNLNMREDVRRQVMIGTAAMQELKFSYYDFFLSNSQLRLKQELSQVGINLILSDHHPQD